MNQSERIKEAVTAAIARGYNKTQIAKKCRVSPATVTQWSNGDTKTLKAENLFGLADLSGFCARWIAIEEGPRVFAEPVQQEKGIASQVTNAASVDLDMLQQILDGQQEIRDEFQHFMKEIRISRLVKPNGNTKKSAE